MKLAVQFSLEPLDRQEPLSTESAIKLLDLIKNFVVHLNGLDSHEPIGIYLEHLEKAAMLLESFTEIPQLAFSANVYIRERLNPFIHAGIDAYDSITNLKSRLAMRLIAQNTSSVFRRVKHTDSSQANNISLIGESVSEASRLKLDMHDMALAGVDILKELAFKQKAPNFHEHFTDEQAAVIKDIGKHILSLVEGCPIGYQHENDHIPVEAYFEF